jgi:hypothetical protein
MLYCIPSTAENIWPQKASKFEFLELGIKAAVRGDNRI